MSGQELIDALCKRLEKHGEICNDTKILNLLRSFDKYEINELTTFGTTQRWKKEDTIEKV